MSGARLGWLVPVPWFAELHAGVQNAKGETMVSFLGNEEVYEERSIGGRPFVDRRVGSAGDLTYLTRLMNSVDVSETITAALGGSALFGPNNTGGSGHTRIVGADLLVKWVPLDAARGWPQLPGSAMITALRLELLTPTQVLIDDTVTKVVAEAENGYFCLLPRHVDFVAALVPGVLTYWSPEGHAHLVAVDEGTLVKCGAEVLVSVRHAVRGTSLERLEDLVEHEYHVRGERERQARSALGRLEAGALRHIGALER